MPESLPINTEKTHNDRFIDTINNILDKSVDFFERSKTKINVIFATREREKSVNVFNVKKIKEKKDDANRMVIVINRLNLLTSNNNGIMH